MRGNTVNTLCLHRTATPMGLTMAEPCILLTVSSETNANRMEHTRCWLAAYTRSRHESQVASQLSSKGVESLLPTYAKLARWSDRIRRSQAPLFPGYLTNNPRFLWAIGLQLSGLRRFDISEC